jgi:hypothetical protein
MHQPLLAVSALLAGISLLIPAEGQARASGTPIDFTLCHPDMVEQLVLVGAVVSGFPYSDHFLNRGMQKLEAVPAERC